MTATVLPVPREELDLLVRGEHGHPHAVLGPHPHEGGVTVRVLKPLAASVVVTWDDERRARSTHEHEGVWVGVLPTAEVPDYRLEVTYDGAPVDARRPLPLPADPRRDRPAPDQRGPPRAPLAGARRARAPLRRAARRQVTGTSFAVWAPTARGVRVKGDFNSWDGREHPMRQLGTSGVWELFVPDVGSGTGYKFVVLGADGQWREKADPMAFHTEVPPATSSVVFESTYDVGRRRLDDAARRGTSRRPRADVDLRDAPRLVAQAGRPAADLPRARRRAGRPTSPTSASPTSSSCR